MNALYTLEFLLQIVNLNAYYQVYDISTVRDRYQACMVSFALTFLLLIFAMNEERYAPKKPIVADTVSLINGGRGDDFFFLKKRQSKKPC